MDSCEWNLQWDGFGLCVYCFGTGDIYSRAHWYGRGFDFRRDVS